MPPQSNIDLLEDQQVEWPHGNSTHFLPMSALEDNQQQRSMLRELQSMLPDTPMLQDKCRKLCDSSESSRKLLAIYFYVSETDGQAILDVYDEGVRDSDLPLKRIYPPGELRKFWLAKNSHAACRRQTHRGCEIGAMREWSLRKVEAICLAQWKLLAPVFKPDPSHRTIPHYDLESACPLPFTDDDSYGPHRKIMVGGYSEVWRVKIHKAHQKLITAAGLDVSRNTLLFFNTCSSIPEADKKFSNLPLQ